MKPRQPLRLKILIALSMILASACAHSVAPGDRSDVSFVEPEVVIATPVLVRDGVGIADCFCAVWHVRLSIDHATGGRFDGKKIDVKLIAGNLGYLTGGKQIAVLIDPAKVGAGEPLIWRRLTEVPCLADDELVSAGLKVEPDGDTIWKVGGDLCLKK